MNPPGTPYNTNKLGETPEEISVQLQSDLSKLEMLIVWLIEEKFINSDSPLRWVLVDHLNNLDAMSKVRLANSLILAHFDNHPEAKKELDKSRKHIRRYIQRMLELRNILSHCMSATIQDDKIVVSHAPKSGITETIIEMEELKQFVGNPWADVTDEIKHIFYRITLKD